MGTKLTRTSLPSIVLCRAGNCRFSSFTYVRIAYLRQTNNHSPNSVRCSFLRDCYLLYVTVVLKYLNFTAPSEEEHLFISYIRSIHNSVVISVSNSTDVSVCGGVDWSYTVVDKIRFLVLWCEVSNQRMQTSFCCKARY
jgi:hypothetical protein